MYHALATIAQYAAAGVFIDEVLLAGALRSDRICVHY